VAFSFGVRLGTPPPRDVRNSQHSPHRKEQHMAADQQSAPTESVQSDGLPEASVQIIDAGPAKKKIVIEIPAERIAASLAEGLDNLRDEAALPGFRKGRVPMRILEKRFGTDVRNEVKNRLIGEIYTATVDKHDLRVLGEPEIVDADKLTLPASGPMAVEIEIEVVPEVTLPEFETLEVRKPKFEVTAEAIDSEIDRIRERHGKFKGVDTSDYNDYITADVLVQAADAAADAQPLLAQSAVQMVVPGEKREFKGVIAGIIIADMGKQIVGKRIGETVVVEATGPARHEVEAMQDKALKITLAITNVQRLELMPVEELLAAMGMETIEHLKIAVRERLESQADQRQKAAMNQQVAKLLLDQVNIELPPKLSSRQAGRILQRRAMDLMYRGVSQQDVEQHLAELRAASEDQAQRELKMLFILDAVAMKLDIDVSESEVNGRIVQLALQQNRRPERMREELIRNGQVDALFIQLREEKAMAQLIGKAKVVEVSEADWNASQETEAGESKPKKKGGSKKKAESAE
jgi:trigger factor